MYIYTCVFKQGKKESPCACSTAAILRSQRDILKPGPLKSEQDSLPAIMEWAEDS